MRSLNSDNPLMRSLSMLGDLIALNLLWMACCLPVVTAGASTAALYAVALKLARGNDGAIFRRFFKAFRQNFRQASVIHLFLCVLIALLAADFHICAQDNGLPGVLPVFLVLTAAAVMIFASWVYPLTAQFENSIKGTCGNAVKLAVIHPAATLRMTGTNAIFLAITCLLWTALPNGLLFWLMLGGSGAAYMNSFALNRCFAHYFPTETNNH